MQCMHKKKWKKKKHLLSIFNLLLTHSMNPEIFEVKLDKNNTYKASIDMTVANAAFEKIHGKVVGNADLQAKLQSFIAQLQAKVADFNQRL